MFFDTFHFIRLAANRPLQLLKQIKVIGFYRIKAKKAKKAKIVEREKAKEAMENNRKKI